MVLKVITSVLYFFYKLIYKLKWFFRKKKVLTQEDLRLIKFMKDVWDIDCIIDKKNYYYFNFTEYDKQKNIKIRK